MTENVLIAIISAGIGSIFTWIVKYVLEKKQEKSRLELEHKIRRYKSSMIFMNVYMKSENFNFIHNSHPDINTPERLKETLKAEYYEMLLYAPDNVIENVRQFILVPTNNQFIKTIKEMRKDLWGKRTDLDDNNLEI